jgi:hypothetical protein
VKLVCYDTAGLNQQNSRSVFGQIHGLAIVSWAMPNDVVAGSSRTNGKRYVTIARPLIPAIDSCPAPVIVLIRSRLRSQAPQVPSCWPRFGHSV